MALQRSHKNTPFSVPTSRCIVICDGVSGPANIGGLFRICEAMGVRELIFCNAEIDFSSPRLQRTSRNTHTKVPYRTSEAILDEIRHLEAKGFTPVAIELTEQSKPIQTVALSNNTMLIIGHERHGISNMVLEAVTAHAHITLYGENSSMNVVQAASIALYALTKL